MIVDALAIVFVVLAGIIFAYHHVGYPVVIEWLANRRRRAGAPFTQPPKVPSDRSELPTVTVLVPAYNEAAVIAAKIDNLVALTYPRDKLNIVIALDGCSDETQAVAQAALIKHGSPPHIELRAHAQNVGKIATLNREIKRIESDVVALSDASAVFADDALLKGASHFLIPQVGVVCATYRLIAAGSAGEAAYTDYQTRLKANESVLAAPIGAHGAFYFFRREAWQEMPKTTINDDFILPMSIVAAGYRGVYDDTIVASELEKTESDQEFNRRIRIGAGNTQQAIWFRKFANPMNGWLAFLFLSGKGMRPWIPFMVIAALLVLVYLSMRGYVLFQLGLVVSLAALAIGAYAIQNRHAKLPRLVAYLGYLLEGHLASMLGAIKYLREPKEPIWPVQPKVPSEASSN